MSSVKPCLAPASFSPPARRSSTCARRVAATSKGRIPARAIVIPGTIPKTFPAGEYGVPCALIIGTRSEATDRKTSLNAALRDFEVPV